MLEKVKEIKDVGIRNIVGEKIGEIKEVGLLPAIRAKISGIRRPPAEITLGEIEEIGPKPPEETIEPIPATAETVAGPAPTTSSTRLRGGM